MLSSQSNSNDQPMIMPEMLKEKVANIQVILKQKNWDQLKKTISNDLKDPIKKMCNKTRYATTKVADAEEIINEANFLELYVEIVNGMIGTQTTSKTVMTDALAILAKDFNATMQKGDDAERKRNFETHRIPFIFLNLILRCQPPVATFQLAVENIKNYAAMVKCSIIAHRPVPSFKFTKVKTHFFESKGEVAKAESKAGIQQTSERELTASIIDPLKLQFNKIMSLEGKTAYLDKAARLAALVTSYDMFTAHKIPYHKVAIVIANTLLKRIAATTEIERAEHSRTLLEFLRVLSVLNASIMADIFKANPVLFNRLEHAIQSNLDADALADYNKDVKIYLGEVSKPISISESKNENKAVPVTAKIKSTHALVLETIKETSDEELDEEIIAGGQVEDPIAGIEQAEDTHYEAEVFLDPDVLTVSPKNQAEPINTTTVFQLGRVRASC